MAKTREDATMAWQQEDQMKQDDATGTAEDTKKLWQNELCRVRVFAGETHSQKVLFETTQN